MPFYTTYGIRLQARLNNIFEQHCYLQRKWGRSISRLGIINIMFKTPCFIHLYVYVIV